MKAVERVEDDERDQQTENPAPRFGYQIRWRCRTG